MDSSHDCLVIKVAGSLGNLRLLKNSPAWISKNEKRREAPAGLVSTGKIKLNPLPILTPLFLLHPLNIIGTGEKHGLDLEGSQFRMLGADQSHDTGYMRRRKAVACDDTGTLVAPGHFDIHARRAEFNRWVGIVIIRQWVLTFMRCH